MGAGPRNAHAPGAAPPTLRSAPLGHFRLFVLNSGRVFFSCSWGGPGGSGAPSPCPLCPRVRPARPQLRRQVSESAPRLAWPVAPAPQAEASARVRARKAPNPGPRPCTLVGPACSAPTPLGRPRPGPDPRGPDLGQGPTSGRVFGERPGMTGSQDRPLGGTRPLDRSPGRTGLLDGPPQRGQGGPDPRTGHQGGPDPWTGHYRGAREYLTPGWVIREDWTLGHTEKRLGNTGCQDRYPKRAQPRYGSWRRAGP